MGKLMDKLQKQLNTEYKQEAEDCIKIYNYLKETTGRVWRSQWNQLTDITFKGLPSDERRYRPSNVGYTFIKGIEVLKTRQTKQ